MRIIYQAVDGREFESENECEQYELCLEIKNNPFTSVFKDGNGVVDFIDDEGYVNDQILYMTITTDEEARRIYKLSDEQGICTPWDADARWQGTVACKAGKYFYDTSIDEWVDFDKFTETYNAIKMQFEG